MGLDQDSKMNCKWIANKYKWITNELQANYKWIASELQINYKWIANELQVNYKWIASELQMNYKWIASELQMNCKVNSLSRKSEKQTSEKEVANSIWTIHRNE